MYLDTEAVEGPAALVSFEQWGGSHLCGQVRTNPQGWLISINEAFAAMVGIPRNERARELNWAQLLAPDELESFDSALSRALTSGEVQLLTGRLKQMEPSDSWRAVRFAIHKLASDQLGVEVLDVTGWRHEATDLTIIQKRADLLEQVIQMIHSASNPLQMLNQSIEVLGSYYGLDRVTFVRYRLEKDGNYWLRLVSQYCATSKGILPIVEEHFPLRYLTPALFQGALKQAPSPILVQVRNQSIDEMIQQSRLLQSALNGDDQLAFMERLQRHFDAYQIQDLLALDVYFDGLPFGILTMHDCHKQRQWDEADLSLIKQVVSHLAMALQKFDLLAQERMAQEQVKESEARFRAMADSAAVIMYVSDADGNLQYVNEARARYLGIPAEQVVEEPWQQWIHPDDLPRLINLEDPDGLVNYPVSREVRIRRHDGRFHWMLLTTAVSCLPNGQVSRYVGVCVDLSEQKLMSKKLEAAKYRFRKLYEWERHTRQLIQILRIPDQDECLTLLLERLGEVLSLDRCLIVQVEEDVKLPIRYEYRRDQALASFTGLCLDEIWPFLAGIGYEEPLFLEDLHTRLHELPETWQTFFRQINIRAAVGLPIRYGDKDLCVLILHSIKPRVWRLHERNFLLNLCEQLAITLYQSKIRRELEKTTQYKSYFLSSISHELRTPMNSVIGYSEMLKNGMAGSLNEHQQRYLGNVISSGKHLLNLINEILDISKIESGAMLVKVEEVALRPLLEEIFSSLETLSVSKHLSMTMELLMDRSNLATDALRLRQILLNLVSNAIKFNRPGGQVRVRVSTQSIHGVPHFRFDVQDTGIGISRHDLAHLFGEFYQVDNSYSRQQEGSGLGLHLTKKLVELLGGSIWVQSEVGVGSIFSFALPVSPTAPHMVSNAQSIEP